MSNVYGLSVSGIAPLEHKLQKMNAIRFDAITTKQLTEMLNRARQPGGTPVDTGELRKSSSKNDDSMGYSADYAAHVEYGHRTINGGYVPGQRFLQSNVEIQQPIYISDLIKAIRKG